jgi:alkylation response protein AidB-like acyl-CoA dehydrogenase
MGIDIETEYGGSGLSFFASVLAVEEIAKVDPALSILIHIHNTLVNALIRKVGTAEQKQKYLPILTQSVVSFDNNCEYR